MQKSTKDCIDPGFGYENGDGYVRVLDKPRGQGGRLVMRHRWFWETFVGVIPDGCEINHLCKNRRCCNIEHLECLTKSQHRAKDNSERYSKDYEGFKSWYLSVNGVVNSQSSLGIKFNRSQACISLWINKIKREIH